MIFNVYFVNVLIHLLAACFVWYCTCFVNKICGFVFVNAQFYTTVTDIEVNYVVDALLLMHTLILHVHL